MMATYFPDYRAHPIISRTHNINKNVWTSTHTTHKSINRRLFELYCDATAYSPEYHNLPRGLRMTLASSPNSITVSQSTPTKLSIFLFVSKLPDVSCFALSVNAPPGGGRN